MWFPFQFWICLENGKSFFTFCSMIWNALATVLCIYIWFMVVFVQSRYFLSILVLVLLLRKISNEWHIVTGGKVGYIKWQKSIQCPWVKTPTLNTIHFAWISNLQAQEMTDKSRAISIDKSVWNEYQLLIPLMERNIHKNFCELWAH